MEATNNIQKYALKGRELFDNDELIRIWMVHHLQIIGEAARKISVVLQTAHPEIPWKEITAMRHILVHDYFGIDMHEVWSSIEQDIPRLENQIKKVLQDKFSN